MQSRLQILGMLIIEYVVLQVLLFGVIAVVLLVLGRFSPVEYSNALFLVGGLIIAFGGIRSLGITMIDRSFTNQIKATFGERSVGEQQRQIFKDSLHELNRGSVLFIVGLAPFIGSMVVPGVFG
jgi:hypothetical protein